MTELIARFLKHPNQLFYFDGLGAMITALSLSLLAYFHTWVGLPPAILYLLVLWAALLSIYSLACAQFLKERWRLFLGVVMAANLIYCFLTAVILVLHTGQVTAFGYLYFIGEKVIILSLVWLEFQVWKKGGN